MSVSGISSNSSLYQTNLTNTLTQQQQDFQALATALQSGNMSNAQTAFAKMQQDGLQAAQTQISQSSSQSGTQSTSQSTSQNSSQSSAYQALATALQNGNLSAAQQAFAQLQQSSKTQHHHHHHHHTKGTDSNQSGGSSQTGSTSINGDSTSTISVTA